MSETLLEKARQYSGKREVSTYDAGLDDEIDLALAYHRREVFAPEVAYVLGIEGRVVSAWFTSVVMKGIRRGRILIERAK